MLTNIAHINVYIHLLLYLVRLCQSEMKALPQMKFNLGKHGLRAPTFQAPLFQASMEHALQCSWEIHSLYHTTNHTTSAAMQGDMSNSTFAADERDGSVRNHTATKYDIKVGLPTELTANMAFNISLGNAKYDINITDNDNNSVYTVSSSQSHSVVGVLDRYIHSICGRDAVCIDTYNQLQQQLSNHTQFTSSNISIDSLMKLTSRQYSLIHRILAAFPLSSFADSIRLALGHYTLLYYAIVYYTGAICVYFICILLLYLYFTIYTVV